PEALPKAHEIPRLFPAMSRVETIGIEETLTWAVGQPGTRRLQRRAPEIGRRVCPCDATASTGFRLEAVPTGSAAASRAASFRSLRATGSPFPNPALCVTP